MTPAEVAEYLDGPGRLVRIGSVGADGAPLVVPTWFVVEDGTFYVTPRERSSWFANLQRDPRVCFTVDGDGCQVIVQGTVQGSIAAGDRIELTATAKVNGSLTAERVVIADGASFNGGVYMGRRTIARRVAQYRAGQTAARP